MSIKDWNIDKTWTLFLDRDGVINLHYPNDYVKDWSEFFFLEGVINALHDLSQIFRRVIIVTNQQGVGKGVMKQEELDYIHSEMLKEIRKSNGRVHAIYAATSLAAQDNKQWRKPAIGMALQAKRDFMEIEFSKSIMVGDTISDMLFGKNAGMKTVFVGDVAKLTEGNKKLVDVVCHNLADFTAHVSAL